MFKTRVFSMKLLMGVCLGLLPAGGLFAQPSLTTTINGKLGPFISGSGSVTSGTYSSGITAMGAAGTTCEISLTNGGGTGATATVALTAQDTIASGAPLKMLDWGTGYTTPPTSGTVITGGTATSCTGTSVTVTTLLNDPLGLNNATFTATISGINPVGVVYNANSITYNNVTVSLAAGTLSLNPACTGATTKITINDPNDGGNDTFALSGCNISGIVKGTFQSTVALAPGSIPAPIAMPFPNLGIVHSPTSASSATYVLNTTNSPSSSTTLGVNGLISSVCNNCPTETLTPSGPMTFTAQSNGTAPATQPITVGTSPTTLLAYAVTTKTTSGGNWLSVNGGTTTGGSTGGSFSVGANPAGLAAGTYTGTISVFTAASTTPQNLSVTFNVTAPTPALSSSPTSLTFSAPNGAAPNSQNLTLNSSGAAISYNVTASTVTGGNWLTVSPASSTTTGTEAVSINSSVLATLASGTYSGSVIFTCSPTSSCSNTSGQLTVPVTLTVTSALQPSPSSLTFNYTIGGTVPAGQAVGVTSNPSGNAITYTAGATTTTGGNWLLVSPASATTPTGVTASLNTSILTGLAAATYTGTITLSSGTASNSPQTVQVTLIVAKQPVLTVSPNPLTFVGETGGANPPSQNVSVNTANGTIPFTAVAASTGNWLSVSPTSGSTNSMVSVSANITGLAPNTYTGTVTVTAPGASGSPAVVNVTLTVGTNLLSTSPTGLNFTYQITGTQPAAQNLTVHTITEGTSFTAVPSAGATWLSVNPSSGTTPGTLSVSVNTTGLAANTYTASIIIDDSGASSNSPLSVPVTLVVSPPPPVTANPTSISFVYQPGGAAPANKTVAIAAGAAAISFNAVAATTTGGTWLAVQPTSGTTPATLTLSVMNYASLAPGTYNGTVTVTPTVSNTVVIPVTLTVSTLSVSPTTLSFNYTTGGTVPAGQSIVVSTTGVNVAYTATVATSTGGSWLQVSPKSGNTPASLVATVVPAGLATGTYNGTITVAATGYTSQVVAATLTVSQPKAVIQITGNASFVLPNTAPPATSTLTIGASDHSAQAFTIAAAPGKVNWLTVSPTSGTTPASVTLTANASGLIPGIYVTELTVTEPALPIPTKTINAQLTVSGSNLVATPSALTISYQPGAPLPLPQTVAVTLASGSGTVALTSVTTDVSWLKVSSATSAPTSLQVTINPGLLTVGTYEGDVIINGVGSPNTALQIPVTLTVNPLPALTATPATLAFNYQLGGTLPAPQSFALSSGDAALNFVVTPPGNWVQVNPARGTTPGSVLVSVDPTGLGAGTYTGNIAASAVGSAGPASIAITLNVTSSQLLNITPGQLFFATPTGGPAPAPQTLTVASASTPMTFTTVASANWLSVTPTGGNTPASLVVSANPAGMQSGTYTGTINVTAAGSQVSQTVVVTLRVGAAAAIPSLTGLINAASGTVGKVSPGLTISVFGQDLGPQTGVSFALPAEGGTVATTLGGTQVLFDGTPVPLLYSSTGQVNAIVPFELTNKASTELQVTYNGNSSTGMTLPVVAAEPGVFTADGSGKGQGSILNQDYSINDASAPAAVGSAIMIFGTGGGTTDPPSVDGALNPLTSTGKLELTTTVTIGGKTAQVLYAGPAPNLVSGIIQVNAVIPDGTPSGDVAVVVTVGDAPSQTVTVAVK